MTRPLSEMPPSTQARWRAEYNECDSGYHDYWWFAALNAIETCSDGTPIDMEASIWVMCDGHMYLVTYEEAIKANTDHLLKRR